MVKGSFILMSPKTLSRCEHAKFEANGVTLEKVLEYWANDGMGYVFLDGQYIGAYHVDGMA